MDNFHAYKTPSQAPIILCVVEHGVMTDISFLLELVFFFYPEIALATRMRTVQASHAHLPVSTMYSILGDLDSG